jgi:nitroreductase
VCLSHTHFKVSGKPNAWASHDTGMATAQLLLQATSENVYCHPMAGYHKDKLIEALKLDESKQPLCVIALGYLQSHELLEEPFKTREITPRVRKSVAEISKKL